MKTLIKSILLLFASQACVGVNIVLSKCIIDHVHPLVLLVVRFTVASILMAIIVYTSYKKSLQGDAIKTIIRDISKITRAEWIILTIQGISAGLLFNLIMLTGLKFTNANDAGLITSLLPVVVVGLNCTIFNQSITKKMLISIAIAFLGLVLVNFHVASDGSSTGYALLGNALILIALIPEGLYYSLTTYKPDKIHIILKSFLMTLVNLPVLLLLGTLVAGGHMHLSLYDYLIMCAIGFATAGFFVFWQLGATKVEAIYSALATAFMPIATVFLAWIILGEGVSVSKLIGMILICFAIFNYASS